MTSQEKILEFFYNMSKDMSDQGYEILNNIKYNFKDYKLENELIKEEIENNMLEQEEEIKEQLNKEYN